MDPTIGNSSGAASPPSHVLSAGRRRAALALCALAAALGLWLRYETAHHDITGLASSCTISAEFDCDLVQASAYARLFGVSVSVWAAVGFSLIGLWLLGTGRGGAGLLVLAGLASGFAALFALFLLAVSVFELGASCLYCNGIQACAVGLAVLLLPPAVRAWRAGGLREGAPLIRGVVAAAVLVGLGVAGNAWADRRVELARLYAMPRGAELEADVSDAIVLGNPGTEQSLLVYFDFTCPRCRGAHQLIEDLLKAYPKDLHAIFKHYPLNRECNPGSPGTPEGHERACDAARASCAAQVLGKGPEYARALFATTDIYFKTILDRVAREVGIDPADWKAAQEAPLAKEILQRDLAEGLRLDIIGVPTMFLNGNRVEWTRLRQILARVIGR